MRLSKASTKLKSSRRSEFEALPPRRCKGCGSYFYRDEDEPRYKYLRRVYCGRTCRMTTRCECGRPATQRAAFNILASGSHKQKIGTLELCDECFDLLMASDRDAMACTLRQAR